jgi:hypothetical protein
MHTTRSAIFDLYLLPVSLILFIRTICAYPQFPSLKTLSALWDRGVPGNGSSETCAPAMPQCPNAAH